MFDTIRRYARWLHTRWPAGTIEKLPVVGGDGSTNVPGLYVAGDLTGIPLLKFSADSGARAVRAIAADRGFQAARKASQPEAVDIAILGAGVAGMAAALEARKAGLSYALFEATEPFSTIENFPRQKPIYAYPRDMVPAGDLRFTAGVKEPLLEELRRETLGKGIEPVTARARKVSRRGALLEVDLAGGKKVRARRVIVAIGRSGNFRKLGVPGEEREKVFNRLHDPHDFCDRDILVVGGGDSALESAIALAQCGARVTLSYRKADFSRPKPENVAGVHALVENPAADVSIEEPVTTSAGPFLGAGRKAGSIRLRMGSAVKEIGANDATIVGAEGKEESLPNDAVFSMIGREAPLDFFRRSGVAIHGEWRRSTKLAFAAILLASFFLYHWKTSAGVPIYDWFKNAHLFPFQITPSSNPATLLGTIRTSAGAPSFYYSLAYASAVTLFGILRIRRRRTPYVTAQTLTLTAIQVIPLFLLPYIILPWLGHNGLFDGGAGKRFADAFFPLSQWEAHGREYWRSVGFVLAWPLMVWNIFTDQPLFGWLAVSFVQTFVVIPLFVYHFGKGAYCGWICSCGALAETVGDTLRTKMPHGPKMNRLNMTGQVVLAAAAILLLLRIVSWAAPEGSLVDRSLTGAYMALLLGKSIAWSSLPFPFSFLNYGWIVDVALAGFIGVGFYWHFSGRVWCRFACPLAALMHVYARFSRFRILAEKKKCISCNVCTSVCHQGIDIMNFANKGLAMEDPECVRCSACVHACPTGVLRFGRVDRKSGAVIGMDRLWASPVRRRESGAA